MGYNAIVLLLLLCLSFVFLVTGKVNGPLNFSKKTTDHIIGTYERGGLILHFDSKNSSLELRNGNGDLLLHVDGEKEWKVSLFGESFIDPQEYSTALLSREAQAELFSEFDMLYDAALAVGYSGGMTVQEYPGILPLYMAALHQPTARVTLGTAPSFDTEVAHANCTKTSEGQLCVGMCGPHCNCWSFVCGDCCFHNGCYCHDLCCVNYVSWSCLFPFGFSCERGYRCDANANVTECAKSPS